MPHTYETDGTAIYQKSFAIIRAEADLTRFDADEEPVVVRMIHAAGMIGLEAFIRFSPGMALDAKKHAGLIGEKKLSSSDAKLLAVKPVLVSWSIGYAD